MLIFCVYALIGFFAQLIDGTAGMAYGLSCRSFLRFFTGLPPGSISAVVHWAEAPVSIISGISHFSLGNVDKPMLLRLLLPGVLGGICGALLVTQIGVYFEHLIEIYLTLMGIFILRLAAFPNGKRLQLRGKGIVALALAGGFLDATGGGGWGQLVSGTLIARGGDVKKIIGSVNLAEAFVTLAEAVTFFAALGGIRSYFPVIGGLVTGGIIAAPLAAWCCLRVPTRAILFAVGIFITVSNLWRLLGF